MKIVLIISSIIVGFFALFHFFGDYIGYALILGLVYLFKMAAGGRR